MKLKCNICGKIYKVDNPNVTSASGSNFFYGPCEKDGCYGMMMTEEDADKYMENKINKNKEKYIFSISWHEFEKKNKDGEQHNCFVGCTPDKSHIVFELEGVKKPLIFSKIFIDRISNYLNDDNTKIIPFEGWCDNCTNSHRFKGVKNLGIKMSGDVVYNLNGEIIKDFMKDKYLCPECAMAMDIDFSQTPMYYFLKNWN